MKKSKLLMVMLLLFTFSGCTNTKIVYIKQKCPKLELIDKNISIPKEVKVEIYR